MFSFFCFRRAASADLFFFFLGKFFGACELFTNNYFQQKKYIFLKFFKRIQIQLFYIFLQKFINNSWIIYKLTNKGRHRGRRWWRRLWWRWQCSPTRALGLSNDCTRARIIWPRGFYWSPKLSIKILDSTVKSKKTERKRPKRFDSNLKEKRKGSEDHLGFEVEIIAS